MAKTKWIVPAIALVICAASLVGAAYAAYTATLQANQNVTTDNNYVVMGLETRSFVTTVDIYYPSTVVYPAVGDPTTKYVPYANVTPVNGLQQFKLGSFSVSIDGDNAGNEVTVNGKYNLAYEFANVVGYNPLAGATLALYTDASCTNEYKVANLNSLDEGTVYYVALEFTQDGNVNTTANAPGATTTINYTLTATANITDA